MQTNVRCRGDKPRVTATERSEGLPERSRKGPPVLINPDHPTLNCKNYRYRPVLAAGTVTPGRRPVYSDTMDMVNMP